MENLKPEQLIDINELSLRLGGISPSTIYRHVRSTPSFPKPLKIGALTKFRASDVELFIRSKLGPQEGFRR